MSNFLRRGFLGRAAAAVSFALLLTTAAHAIPTPDTLPDPAQEARARNLQKQLRCVVCQGESLDDSGADLAADLRHLVREHIKAGESDAQIKQFLVARYGNFILMDPPVEGDTLLLWAAPGLVLILAGGVAIYIIRRAQRNEASGV